MAYKNEKMRAKKIKTARFMVHCDVYPFSILFSFGEDFKTLKKYLLTKGCKEDDVKDADYPSETAAGYYMMFKDGASLIRLKEIPHTPRGWAWLHHEILHAVFAILKRVGIKYHDRNSEEAFTYLNQFIVEQVYIKLFP